MDRYNGGDGVNDEEEEEESEKYSNALGGGVAAPGSLKLTLLLTRCLNFGIAFGVGIGEVGLDPLVPVRDLLRPRRDGDRALTTSKKRFGSLWWIPLVLLLLLPKPERELKPAPDITGRENEKDQNTEKKKAGQKRLKKKQTLPLCDLCREVTEGTFLFLFG